MESVPKLGMYYESARRRLKKMEAVKTNPWLRNSLINQAKLHEGAGAAKELNKELNYDTINHSGNTVAYSPKYSERWEKIFGKRDIPRTKND